MAVIRPGGAANFGEKKIDVWNTAFWPVKMSFKDPYLPEDYSPYNIQAVGDWLFVRRFASRGTLNIPWGITMAPGSFPPASAGIDPARLYFSAGPEKETDGIFGYLIKQ